MKAYSEHTICAISTPPGIGGIAVIRVSGKQAFDIVEGCFSKRLSTVSSHSLHFGTIRSNGKLVDEVVCAVFKGPNSFTGEDIVEISCHGSTFIQHKMIDVLLQHGAKMAEPGEFTLRAYLNGKMDLSQAEAVADLIHSESAGAHELAMKQMRGGFSKEIATLREELINFASLIELELDFSEEDVEFADRSTLTHLINKVYNYVEQLIDSFRLGNVIKNGIPVAIAGAPNVGKSTLLNALLNEERAIVSDIAGTTRDTIEDTINIEGNTYRFIDTAGIRKTEDVIESKGIERTFQKVDEAEIVLYLIEADAQRMAELTKEVDAFHQQLNQQEFILIINKSDLSNWSEQQWAECFPDFEIILLSAKAKHKVDRLRTTLAKYVADRQNGNAMVVTNQRHLDALLKTQSALHAVQNGLQTATSGDLLAMDIREALYHLGSITGEISTDDLLGNIFANFCIGK